MSAFINDIKHSVRRLRRRPGFTAIALIMLAVGIGANTVLFSVVNALVLRPKNLKEPEQLTVCRSSDDFGWFPYPVFDAIRQDNPLFSDVMAFTLTGDCTVTCGGRSQSVYRELISSNYFSVLGVAPVLGRTLEGAYDGTRRIVGIVPGTRHHVFEARPLPQIYYPIDKPQTFFMVLRVADSMVGREATLLNGIRREIRSVHPDIAITPLCPLADYHRDGTEMWAVRVMAGLALLFGIISLFLATLGIYGVKGYAVATRIPEFGIRMALGATGRDIKTMVLRDGAILTLIGLGAGLALALTGAYVLGLLFLGRTLCDVSPIDPLSILVTVVFLALASLVAGYLPARRAAKVDPMNALRYE